MLGLVSTYQLERLVPARGTDRRRCRIVEDRLPPPNQGAGDDGGEGDDGGGDNRSGFTLFGLAFLSLGAFMAGYALFR